MRANLSYPGQDLRFWFYERIRPLERLLVKAKVRPDALSFCGLVFCAITGLLYGKGLIWLAGITLGIAGLCDVFDGIVARNQGKASKRGAFLDSTLDRLGEIALFGGLIYHFGAEDSQWFLLVLALGLGGSFMVSYTRARAEGLGIDCKVGLFQRPERFLLLIAGSLLSWIPYVGMWIFKVIMIAMAVLSAFTTFERMRHILRSKELGGGK